MGGWDEYPTWNGKENVGTFLVRQFHSNKVQPCRLRIKAHWIGLNYDNYQKIFLVTLSHQRDAGSNTLLTYMERIFMLILQKIFLVTMSQQRDAASNTLPTYRKRIFMLILRKNLFGNDITFLSDFSIFYCNRLFFQNEY